MEEKQTIFFDEETCYEIGGTKYIIISHFDENGEDITSKMVRLLKTDIQNTLAQNL